MRNIHILILSLLLFSFKNIFISPVTGPSHGEAIIKPIGFSEKGVILCLTEYSVNPMGAHDLMDTEFGYLIVDKNGLWEEKIIQTIYNLDGYDKYDKYKNEFYLPVDFKRPPKYLTEVIEKYNIEYTVWRNNENLFFWNKEGLKDGNEKTLNKTIEQKSIKNLKSTPLKGTLIGNSYELKGVVFFNNYETYDQFSDSTVHSGAYFFEKEFEYPLEIYNVTGIAFINN